MLPNKGFYKENHWILRIFDATTFKWSYLGAQEELVGQTVVVTQYLGPMLHGIESGAPPQVGGHYLLPPHISEAGGAIGPP